MGVDVHCLRDLTRGGLATAVNEIASARGVSILMEESSVPVEEVVKGACEILGLDPPYVANEGRFVAFVPARQKDRALDELKRFSVCRRAAHIGEVTAEVAKEGGKSAGVVTLHSRIGGNRVLDLLSGEQLPRIC